MKASVVVCSHNRADSLAETLAALKSQVTKNILWEIIVVDNNSTDHTKSTVESAKSDTVSIVYAFEPNQGLSYARNTGISLAKGDIIIFTDDDVLPASNWIQTTIDNMEETNCAACGGYIEPIWQSPPPDWLTEKFHGFLAIKMDESGPKAITDVNNTPYGANMAFRKEIFLTYGLFDVNRGRKGNNLASGEDGVMFEKIIQAGESVMYFPSVRVKHKVESFRLKKSYFRRWRFQSSRNISMTVGLPGNRRLLGVPLYIFPQTVKSMLNAVLGYIILPADAAFRQEITAWHFLGVINGLVRTWINSKKLAF
jgi:glycosyltransferase involved in cell wall biosynthesis